MNQGSPDLLVVGAGPVGCVVSERAAKIRGWKSLLIDRRNHIAGNCHDRLHESGLLIHPYGPHYFRTSNQALLDYLSAFTSWIPGNYKVKSLVNGELFPFPINLDTLEKFFQCALDSESAALLLSEKSERFPKVENSEELLLSRLGRDLYEAFYLGYTRKQWAQHPRDLAPSVCGRVPIRFNRDDSYVEGKFQLMPAEGYTRLFSRMIDHPLIELNLNVDYRALKEFVKPRIATIFCGPIDEYFNFRLGPLPWRSLSFEHNYHSKKMAQPCVQINYPGADVPYTRSVEIKHVTGQTHPGTVVSLETPRSEGEPFYPVPSHRSDKLYLAYQELAAEENRNAERPVYFIGRLACYKYINTDEAIEMALQAFSNIEKDFLFGRT
jgi:UDP-galactopyranose mutase